MGQPLTFYGMSSPNARKVAILLEEIGLPYRPEHVAVFRGRQFDESFLALSPMAKVPVIVDPDGPAGAQPIFESGAILIYLAESYAPQFYPADGPARWQVLKWLMLQMSQVGPVFGQHSHYRLMPNNGLESQDYAAGRARRGMAQIFQALERRLGEVEWLGGEAYSIADVATYPWAKRLRRYGLDPAEYPQIMAWRAAIEARPAIERAHRVIAAWARQDTADRAAATRKKMKCFRGFTFARRARRLLPHTTARSNPNGKGRDMADLSRRRVVTGLDAIGRSTVLFDGPIPHADDTTAALVWRTHGHPADNSGGEDTVVPYETAMLHTPGSNFVICQFRPRTPEIMHATNTIDYLVILSGRVILVLEQGETELGAGDCVVDRGVVHGWRNPHDEPCIAAVVNLPAYPVGKGRTI